MMTCKRGLTPTQVPSVKFDTMIPYGRQDISQADIDAVVEVLRSDFLTQGPMVPRFEEAVAQYCDAQHAVAVNNATSALHIACLSVSLARVIGYGLAQIHLWPAPTVRCIAAHRSILLILIRAPTT